MNKTMFKKKYKPTFLINIDAKIFDKTFVKILGNILANQMYQHIDPVVFITSKYLFLAME